MPHTALITGASRGIGAAIAKRFAAEGYHLALCCRDSGDELDALSEELRQTEPVEVLTFLGDVSDPAFVRDMCDRTLSRFGSVGVLVNNAGISRIGLLTDLAPEDWNRMLSVNLTSAFLTCRALIPSMVSRGRGRILNISSVWGGRGASCEAAYAAAKGGLDSLTRSLGKELAPSGIAVNAIACGMVDTQMNAGFSGEELAAILDEIPAGRMASPSEVADTAWLLANAPVYLTGQVLTLDGGWM